MEQIVAMTQDELEALGWEFTIIEEDENV